MPKIKAPLDSHAVRVANAALRSAIGDRMLSMKKKDYALRKRWASAYYNALYCEKGAGPLGSSSNMPTIDSGTLALSNSTTFSPLNTENSSFVEEEIFVDELTPIAEYMSLEMNVNARGTAVKKMLELNRYSMTECIEEYQELPLWQQILGLGITPDLCVNNQITFKAAALLLWAEKVRQNGPWDHKPIIAKRFNPRNPGGPQHWHLLDDMLYFYDVWSNIHYGYVGKAAGFSNAVLLDGAGLEQIGSTLIRGKLPTKDPAIEGLRAWDDKQDRVGVELGIRLYKSHKNNITSRLLVKEIKAAIGISTKLFIQ